MMILGQLLFFAQLILTLHASSSNALQDAPTGNCSIAGQACDMEENVVTIIQHVFTIEECRIICQDEPSCNFISYFGPNSFPFSETCMLFSSCDDVYECGDCRTEDILCLPCSTSVQSHLGDNLLQFLPHTEDELSCKTECMDEDGCNFYVYYNSRDQSYPNTCFLLSSLQDPILPCDNCRTGPMDCHATDTQGRCVFLMQDGSMTSSGQLFTYKNDTEIVDVVAVGSCSLTIVAIGGGAGLGREGGGGGSGYIAWKDVVLTKSLTMLVTVGKGGYYWAANSSLVLREDGELLLEASPGESGTKTDGGNGYSGGGGAGGSSGYGGTDGGDGHSGYDGSGGRGSGVNVSDISTFLEGFILSPGSGGHGYYAGGGGGGVLVNGQGPQGAIYRGQGYGGGGGYEGEGNPGVVIISPTHNNVSSETVDQSWWSAWLGEVWA